MALREVYRNNRIGIKGSAAVLVTFGLLLSGMEVYPRIKDEYSFMRRHGRLKTRARQRLGYPRGSGGNMLPLLLNDIHSLEASIENMQAGDRSRFASGYYTANDIREAAKPGYDRYIDLSLEEAKYAAGKKNLIEMESNLSNARWVAKRIRRDISFDVRAVREVFDPEYAHLSPEERAKAYQEAFENR